MQSAFTSCRAVSSAIGVAAMLFITLSASAGVLNESTKLTASDAAAGDEFGYSVSISGDTAIAGA